MGIFYECALQPGRVGSAHQKISNAGRVKRSVPIQLNESYRNSEGVKTLIDVFPVKCLVFHRMIVSIPIAIFE
ncbi:MAG: hypothetical protein DWB56_14530 [Candidatus Jettenia sp.]|nr:hypothetical protein [Candidatus Jettenia sp.]